MLMVMEGGGGGSDNTCHILKTRGCCLSLQANEEEEVEVDRDVKMMGVWRWRIWARGPQVLEINYKLSCKAFPQDETV